MENRALHGLFGSREHSHAALVSVRLSAAIIGKINANVWKGGVVQFHPTPELDLNIYWMWGIFQLPALHFPLSIESVPLLHNL